MDQKIFLDYMNARLDDMLRDTDRLMRFESLLEKPEETEAALDCVLKLAQDMGMRTGKTPRGDAGYAEIGDGSETVGILVHVDVVGIGDRSKWHHPPFELTRKDGMLWGRGVVDDKGAVIMSLYAMKALLDLNIPLKKIFVSSSAHRKRVSGRTCSPIKPHSANRTTGTHRTESSLFITLKADTATCG